MNLWRIWAKSLGQKASECDVESDRVAIVRSIVLFLYMLTNFVIMAGVIRHWNDV